MNEFYSPRRENKNTNETAYAEPADELNIVVDDNDTGAAFCSKCGNRLDAGDAFCSRCGAKTFGSSQSRTQQQYSQPTAQAQTQTAQQPQNVYNYNYNYSTTTTTNTSANVNSGNVNSYAYGHGKLKDKRVSLILCLLFGIFGAHRFYEGKIFTGLLYLCTCGLFGIGWLVNLIILLSKPGFYEP